MRVLGVPSQPDGALFGTEGTRSVREVSDSDLIQPVDGPAVDGFRAELAVEADRRLVPVEHGPLDASATAFEREPRELGQERTAVSAPAALGLHEEVFEVDAGPAEERREVVEEQREAGRVVLVGGDENLRVRTGAEEVLAQRAFVEHDVIRQLLVLGEAANEGGNLGDIFRFCGSDHARNAIPSPRSTPSASDESPAGPARVVANKVFVRREGRTTCATT